MVRWWLALLLSLSLDVTAQSLKVAVAANFKPTLKQLKSDFEQQHKIKVSLSSASSGVLYAQIIKGAPYDVFLSADQARPKRLEQQGWIETASRQTYAIGVLVLWHITDEFNQKDLEIWQEKIAIANPKTAPYGQAAKSVLQHLELWRSKRQYLVTGSNVAQAFQFIASGNARAGMIALSQVKSQVDWGKYWILPQSWYDPIHQQAVILKRSKNKTQALAFMQWLMSDKVQTQIQALGYAKHVNP